MGVAEKVFRVRSEVRGQGRDQTECYKGRGVPFDGVAHLFISVSRHLLKCGFKKNEIITVHSCLFLKVV